MYIFDVTLKGLSKYKYEFLDIFLIKAGSSDFGSSFEVYLNYDKDHALITFYKNVESLHEGYFDVVHELVDSDVLDYVVNIERVLS